MPAIEFSRLRTKIELLGRVYVSPQQFVKELTEFYASYADLTFQSDITPNSAVNSAFRTPAVLNRELEHTFKPYAKANPDTTLQIIDLMWQTKTLEPRQFAAALLGALPINYGPQVLERIRLWSSIKEDHEFIPMLHAKGSATLRQDQPELWLNTLRDWIQTKEIDLEKQAVLGLLPFANDPDFNNLPIIFDFLQPLLLKPDPHLIFPLLSVIEKIAGISELETVYFLKQLIRTADNQDLPRFIRRSLTIFSLTSQTSLKTCLREHASGL